MKSFSGSFHQVIFLY